jgi:hypothetical protein
MTDHSKAFSTKETAEPAWLAWLPHILVACWLLFLAASIWQHALHSVQPPVHDPLTYMQKAANFWRSIDSGHLFNPLNLEPTVRPPGTILMSYPFGFTPDVHGFHFRSVFLPLLCIVAAVYLAAGLTHVKTCGWRVAAMAFLFSSLPMFYWMDRNSYWIDWTSQYYTWGFVDTFQAGIAAMAVAAILRSQVTRSRVWLLVGALLASFTLLIKPSGLMIMALTFLIWLMMIGFEWILAWRLQRPKSSLKAYTGNSGVIFLFSYASIILLCVFSDYLSAGNFHYARQILAMMRKIMVNISFLPLFHRSSGELMPLLTAGMSVLLVRQVFVAGKNEKTTVLKAIVLLLAAFVTWISGAWYWLVVQAGGSQIRYFYPFMLMGCICLVSPALYVWSRIRRPASWILTAVCFLPALNMMALLAAGDSPSGRWQNMTGVQISVGGYREEISQGRIFLKEIRKTKRDARVYFFANTMPTQIFACAGIYEKIIRPDLASFSPIGPINWTREMAVEIGDLLACEYILVYKYSDKQLKANLSSIHLDTLAAESRAFESWVLTQNERSGLETVSDGRNLRLLRIVDRPALNNAMDQFVSKYEWRPEFKAANPPMWWNRDTTKSATRELVMEDIGFGGIYKLHALAIHRIEEGIKIDFWWEELRHEEANDERFLFFHLIDTSGKIKYKQQIGLFPYDPPDSQKRWRHGTTTFSHMRPDSNLTEIAFGIYRPGGQFLLPDKALTTDWEGRRVLVPLNVISGPIRK